ncbi:MAG: 30S ribosomal protein S1 [Lentisphaeraceae bacterium]|nr:30S ribosomal protein S1 [Lentisphaeraceae bacterium]
MAIRKPQKAVEKTGALYDELLAALDQQNSVPAPGTIVKGKVTGKRGNEVLVDIGCKSAGSINANEFEDVEAVNVGDTFDVLLIDLEGDNGMVVVSKRQADEKIRWEAILAKYKEGDTVSGVIKSKVRGGMIVAVDGVEAFLPGSQVDVNPSRDLDIYVTDTPQDFKIIKISDERRNIIVSRRELLEAQMAEKKHALLAKLEKGQIVHGKVKNITDFGAFVDLDGMDGLLHITDMSWGRIKHPSELLKVGQELDVMILDVDLERERVSLGLKQAQSNPWDNIESRYPVGSRLRGKVVNLAPYGAFVELEPGIEGLVHVSEFSWTKRIARASDVLNIGDEVDVVVLNIDSTNQKIALGIRQTEANPWDTVQDRYPVGSRISGKVRNFTTYGAFVEMEEGIDGMIHVSDMSWTRKINHPSEVLQKGQTVEAIVLEIDAANQRISLGLKQAQTDPWASIASTYHIGQIVKGKVSKIASFGAFIELEDGVDGLVHISQISDQRIEKVKDALKVGQEVEARIIKIDREERRIGLSIKAVNMDEGEVARLTAEAESDVSTISAPLGSFANAFEEAFASSEEWQPGQK